MFARLPALTCDLRCFIHECMKWKLDLVQCRTSGSPFTPIKVAFWVKTLKKCLKDFFVLGPWERKSLPAESLQRRIAWNNLLDLVSQILIQREMLRYIYLSIYSPAVCLGSFGLSASNLCTKSKGWIPQDTMDSNNSNPQFHSVGSRFNFCQFERMTVLSLNDTLPVHYLACIQSEFSLHLLVVKSSLCIPPIQSVPVIMIMREPYGRHKHKWGQRSGKWQATEYLHNKKNIHPDDYNATWRRGDCLSWSCLLSCVCINQHLCSCSSQSCESSGGEGKKCEGSGTNI